MVDYPTPSTVRRRRDPLPGVLAPADPAPLDGRIWGLVERRQLRLSAVDHLCAVALRTEVHRRRRRGGRPGDPGAGGALCSRRQGPGVRQRRGQVYQSLRLAGLYRDAQFQSLCAAGDPRGARGCAAEPGRCLDRRGQPLGTGHPLGRHCAGRGGSVGTRDPHHGFADDR